MHASAGHIFAALRLVSGAERPLGVADVARLLGLSMSTAHRALMTLLQAGYLRRADDGPKFEIGRQAERLVLAAFRQFRLREAAVPYLRQLTTASGATASLSVRLGWYAMRLAAISGADQSVAPLRRLGQPLPLHADPAAHALIAALPPADMSAYRVFVTDRHPALAEEAEAELRHPRLRQMARKGYVFRAGGPGGFGVVSFPLRLAEDAVRVIGAIAVEFPAPRGAAAEDAARLREWQAIVARLELAVRGRPDHFADPFAHVPNAEIDFPPIA